MIERRGEFLLRQRPPGGHLAGLWEFPGGKVEADESWERALVREAREELDVAVRAHGLIEEKRFEYPERVVHLRFYRAVIEAGEPRAVEPEAPIRWVKAAQLTALPVPEANRDLVARLAGAAPGRVWTLELVALAAAPLALLVAGMTVMAAENAARLAGSDLAHLAAALPGRRFVDPHVAVLAIAFVLAEAVALGFALRAGVRSGLGTR